MNPTTQSPQTIKTLPWGEEVYLEFPLHKKSANKFYARHGKTSEGRQYIEFYKYGPKPNTDGERYMQKFKLFTPVQWMQIKHYVEGDLSKSIGWDLDLAQKDFQKRLNKAEEQVEAPIKEDQELPRLSRRKN